MARHRLYQSNLPTLGTGIHSDGDGLYLRVKKSGARSWIFVWRRGDTRHEIGLGGFGQGTAPVSLALARRKADEVRAKLAEGEDPRAEKKAAAVTFRRCMDELLAIKMGELKNAGHRQTWAMTLEEYAKPLHALPVAAITVADVKAVLVPHWKTRPGVADRLRSRIAAVIDFGIAHQWRTGANPAKWTGLLDKLLPPRTKLVRGHFAAVPYSRIPEVMQKLRRSTGMSARAAEFICLTAARSAEAREAVWAEIDFDAALWTIPAARTKTSNAHQVPLADRAIAILREVRSRSMSAYVFGGEREGRPISDVAVMKALRRATGDESTIHGLRSSFRDWCGDQTDYPRELAEQALAHTISNQAEAAYRRGTALEKRRELMAVWAAFCGSSEK